MNKSMLKKNSLLKIMSSSLLYLPTPVNITIWWNFGSLLGLCLMIQIISGFLLSMHYCPNMDLAFLSILHIMQNINYGWLLRFFHMNGASFFFICIYIHIARGIYYHSFKYFKTWNTGVLILLITMATAFLGYVLPWGQMSFWGATVITNLLSAIPLIGETLVQWIWGGYSIDNATLNRFYSMHFILPFIILFLMLIHLFFLHSTGSNNPLGLNSNLYKIPFHNYFIWKDLLGFMIFMIILVYLIIITPNFLSDPDNFVEADSMNTPMHIKPEWYFLFAYAILRSIPNKLSGVIALFMSILVLSTLSFYKFKFNSNYFNPLNQLFYWMFINSFIILTWTGSQSIQPPFIIISQLTSFMYFFYFIVFPFINNSWMLYLYK